MVRRMQNTTPHRPRRSKYPDTHPAYWLNVCNWNRTHGRPTWLGVPDEMTEAVKMLNRSRQAKWARTHALKRKREKEASAQSAVAPGIVARVDAEIERSRRRLCLWDKVIVGIVCSALLLDGVGIAARYVRDEVIDERITPLEKACLP